MAPPASTQVASFIVIGYSSTERASDCVVSLACGANGVHGRTRAIIKSIAAKQRPRRAAR